MRAFLAFSAVLTLCCCGGHNHSDLVHRSLADLPVTTTEPPKAATASGVAPDESLPPAGSSSPGGNTDSPASVIFDAFNDRLTDIYFNYDQSDLTSLQLATLQKDASLLRTILAEFPRVKIVIAGHCDERGSAEYNLALGDRRAQRVAQSLSDMGVHIDGIETVSYGKEQPQCEEPTEACWSKNRRAHLTAKMP
jgi:peptidoglycan-associated lipoprotein